MKKRKYIDASYTVEAAFILPIIVFVMIGFIYLCFYLYNRIIAETQFEALMMETMDYLNYGASMENGDIAQHKLLEESVFQALFDQADNEKRIMDRAKEITSKGYFYASLSSFEIEIGFTEVIITGEVAMHLPVPKILQIILGKKASFSVLNSKSRVTKEEKTRIYTVVSGSMGKIKGIGEALDQFKGLYQKFHHFIVPGDS